MRRLLVLGIASAAAGIAVAVVRLSSGSSVAMAASPAERAPVVVELFSSEGCSSCPPADAVLARLARDQPVAGAEVIALELHVDYWNDLGWPDPFSSPAFTARQRAYSTAFGQRGAYTPQAVVDGASEVVGSNEGAARSLVFAAAREPKAAVRVTVRDDKASVTVAGLSDKTTDAELWVAITEAGLVSAVPRGENAGRRLAHAPVVRSLQRVGPVAPGARDVHEVALTIKPEWRRDALRAVAFLQQRGSLRIVGASSAALP